MGDINVRTKEFEEVTAKAIADYAERREGAKLTVEKYGEYAKYVNAVEEVLDSDSALRQRLESAFSDVSAPSAPSGRGAAGRARERGEVVKDLIRAALARVAGAPPG